MINYKAGVRVTRNSRRFVTNKPKTKKSSSKVKKTQKGGSVKKCSSSSGQGVCKIEVTHEESCNTQQCTICGKEFSDEMLLKKHVADANSHKRPFMCSLETCSRTFSQVDHLINHRLIHPDTRPHRCSRCHMQFSNLIHLNRHSSFNFCKTDVNTSVTVSNISCPVSFTKEPLQKLHQDLRHYDTSDLTFSCETCSEIFSSISSLLQHEESHLSSIEEAHLCCPIVTCTEKFYNVRDLLDHHQLHNERQTCRNCSVTFKTPLEMLVHRLKCEEFKIPTSPHCLVCKRSFKATRFLEHHLEMNPQCRQSEQVTKKDTTQFRCDFPLCKKIFQQGVLLRNHLYSHTENPFHCCQDECQHSFSILENYQHHCISVHGDELNLIHCDDCADVFTVKSHHESHREDAHRDFSYDLQVFEDEQTNEEDSVSCPFCGASFAASKYLRVHLVSVHPPPWSCEQCGISLSSLIQARSHLKVHQIVLDKNDTEKLLAAEEDNIEIEVAGGMDLDTINIPGIVTLSKEKETTVQKNSNDISDIVCKLEPNTVPIENSTEVNKQHEIVHIKQEEQNKQHEMIHIKQEAQMDIGENASCDTPMDINIKEETTYNLYDSILKQSTCPAVGDFAKAFNISINSIQHYEIPEILEPDCQSTLTNGLAIDLLEFVKDKGVDENQLTEYLTRFMPGKFRTVVTPALTANVMSKLDKIRVQARRFRAKYKNLPMYLNKYLTERLNPFTDSYSVKNLTRNPKNKSIL